jgi:hypothetical protein
LDQTGYPIVAGYEVEEELGRGPTGVRFYRATQTVLNRPVLLKVVLAREDSGQRAWGGLRGEASALARLNHPNIVPIHDAGERDRQLFYNAVEFISGPDLGQKVAEQPLPVAQIVRLLETLAHALDHAHQRGILHRNLKPTSILLQPAGDKESEPLPGAWCRLHSKQYQPRITDFGLARKPSEGEINDLELFGDQGGYLAPEQAWGRTRDIGPGTDVYGLGGILYFLLVGRPPFRGPTVSDLIDAIHSAELTPPSALRSLPADLEAICRKALARNPRRRYPAARDFALDLRRFREHLPIQARPRSAFYNLGRWVRRRPAVAGLLVVGLVGGVATLSAFGWAGSSTSHLEAELVRARQALARQQSLTQQAEAKLRAGQQQVQFGGYCQRINEAAGLLDANQHWRVPAILDNCPGEFRHWEWHYLMQRVHRRGEVVLPVLPGPITALACDRVRADGGAAFRPSALLAVAAPVEAGSKRSQVRVWTLPNGEERMRLEGFDAPVLSLAISNDGQSLVTVGSSAAPRGGVLRRWMLQNERRMLYEQRSSLPLTGVAWSPDGQSLFVLNQRGQLNRLSAGTGQPQRASNDPDPFRGNRNVAPRLVLHPDGSWLASMIPGEPGVRLWDSSSCQLMFTIQPRGGQPHALAWGPEGRLAIGLSDNTIRIYDVTNNTELAHLAGHGNTVVQLAFSQDGNRLASASADGSVKVWGWGGSGWQEVLTLKRPGKAGLAFVGNQRGLVVADENRVSLLGSLGE